jgi:ABC-type Fe3+/spermidine/putrescine transport system ATPase subunit
MRDEIRRIHDETRITTLYVTHDQKEALSMADRMAVLREGVIEQIGGPREVYRRPANRFVAEFIGEANWLPGTLRPGPAPRVETPAGVFHLPTDTPIPATPSVQVGFRPEALRFGPSPVNAFEATLGQVTYLGEIEQYILLLPDGTSLKAFEQDPATRRERDQRVQVHLPPEGLFLLPPEPAR